MKKIKINKIYNEDCLKTLKKIPDSFVDCVITSPPYNMNLRINKGKYISRQIVKEFSTRYDNFSDNLPIEEYYKFHKKVISELLRTSKIIFYNIQIVTGSKRAFFKIIGEYHKFLKDVIVWDKGHAQPAMKEQVLNKQTELILVFESDYPISRQFKNATFKRGTLSDIWHISREKKNISGHSAVFPEELVATILQNFTKKDDLIYDPFMGTGTTALVSKKMNRNFIGSEIIKEYCDIANNRIQLEEDSLF